MHTTPPSALTACKSHKSHTLDFLKPGTLLRAVNRMCALVAPMVPAANPKAEHSYDGETIPDSYSIEPGELFMLVEAYRDYRNRVVLCVLYIDRVLYIHLASLTMYSDDVAANHVLTCWCEAVT